VQAFYATFWHALLRLDNNRHRLFVVDSSEKGFGVKKPDLALSTIPKKLPAYVVYTASLKKLIKPGGLQHEVVSQCNERMQSLLLPQQPERGRYLHLLEELMVSSSGLGSQRQKSIEQLAFCRSTGTSTQTGSSC
jgi:hypothetical protein